MACMSHQIDIFGNEKKLGLDLSWAILEFDKCGWPSPAYCLLESTSVGKLDISLQHTYITSDKYDFEWMLHFNTLQKKTCAILITKAH